MSSTARPDQSPADQSSLNPWPALAVIAIFVVGIVLIVMQHWRRGSFLLGLACLVAALLRCVLSDQKIGVLAIRSKPFDLASLGTLGVALMVLALAVPGTFN